MTETVILHNTMPQTKKEVFAADGDSVHIMPGSKQPVDKKFLWRLPEGVVELKQYETTFMKKKNPDDEQKLRVKEVSEKIGNDQNPEDDRQTVKTTVKK